MAKIFTSILNKRIVTWIETHKKNIEAQAGFTRKYKTIDNIYSLEGMIEKYLTRKGQRFYTLFVDFAKAFDSIDREKLFYRIHRLGIHGNMLRIIQNLYNNTQACVWTHSGLGDLFNCTTGVRQGNSLSPTLFLIYINESRRGPRNTHYEQHRGYEALLIVD